MIGDSYWRDIVPAYQAGISNLVYVKGNMDGLHALNYNKRENEQKKSVPPLMNSENGLTQEQWQKTLIINKLNDELISYLTSING